MHGAAKTLLILGASGDLTARLLLPGLGGLIAAGGAEGLLLIGSGADDWDDDRWREQVAASFAAAGVGGAAAERRRRRRPLPTGRRDLRGRSPCTACDLRGADGDLLRPAAGGGREGLRGADPDRCP